MKQLSHMSSCWVTFSLRLRSSLKRVSSDETTSQLCIFPFSSCDIEKMGFVKSPDTQNWPFLIPTTVSSQSNIFFQTAEHAPSSRGATWFDIPAGDSPRALTHSQRDQNYHGQDQVQDQLMMMMVMRTMMTMMTMRTMMMTMTLTPMFRDDDESAATENDWKFAAMVLDRLCLITFTLFTIIATFAVLAAAPHVIVT